MPKRPQLVVVDSTPIIALIEQLLRGGIHLSDSVVAEVLRLAEEA